MSVGRRGGWSGGCGYDWCRDAYASIWRISKLFCALPCLVVVHGGLDGLDYEQSRGLWRAAGAVLSLDFCGMTTKLARENGECGGCESDLRGCYGEMIWIQGDTRSSEESGHQRERRCAPGCRRMIESRLPAIETIVSMPDGQVTRAAGGSGPGPEISRTTVVFLERDCRWCC